MKNALKMIYRALPFKQPVFKVIRSLVKPGHSMYKHLWFHGLIDIDVSDGSKFKIYHHGFAQENHLFWAGIYGSRHKGSLALWQFLCHSDAATILDIGANTGLYSLIAKSVAPQSDVHAFEPVQRVHKKLKQNTDVNGFDIKCNEIALSDKTGSAVIFDESTEHTYSVTVNKNLFESATAKEVTIQTQRLDEYIADKKIERIDLIKIDVETHEPEVLAGMGKYLAAFRPDILIEILDQNVAAKVTELIEGLGYVYFDVRESEGSIHPVTTLDPNENFNFLICKPETAERLKHFDFERLANGDMCDQTGLAETQPK